MNNEQLTMNNWKENEKIPAAPLWSAGTMPDRDLHRGQTKTLIPLAA